MSKKELRERKLDTRWLWGVGAGIFSLGATAFFLVSHKNKHREEERARGIDHRTEIRCQLLRDQIKDISSRIDSSRDETERMEKAQLLGQAKLKLTQLINERSLPICIMVTLEKIHEAEAELDNALYSQEDSD